MKIRGITGSSLLQARASVAAAGVFAERTLAKATASTTSLWRVVAINGITMYEGFHSLFDSPGPIQFSAVARGIKRLPAFCGHD